MRKSIDREEFRLLSDLMPAALQDRDLGQVAPSAEFTLYPLEPLSYIVYYLTDDRYAGVARSYARRLPTLSRTLPRFPTRIGRSSIRPFPCAWDSPRMKRSPKSFAASSFPNP